MSLVPVVHMTFDTSADQPLFVAAPGPVNMPVSMMVPVLVSFPNLTLASMSGPTMSLCELVTRR